MILKNEFRVKINISNSMTSSLNLGSLFGEIQCKLEKNITSMLNDVHLKNSEYKELHDNIMSLPAVAKLVAENKLLREKLAEYESESRKICLEVVEKEIPVNTKKIIYTNSGESMITDDLCNCDLCSNIVNCLKQNIFILTRGDDEEMVLCVECFEDHKMRLKTDHWKSDDFSEDDSSSDEEEEDEDDEEEEEEEEDKPSCNEEEEDKPSCNEEEFGMDIKEVEAIIKEEESKPLCNEEDEPSCNEEDPDAFECDDCNVKDVNCFEHLGISKDEIDIYRDLGEPDRCHDCFEKWKNSEDGSEYLKMVDGKDNEEHVKLCVNMDCVKYPPDWDAEKDTEETYQEDPWLKCNQCDGYYNNDGGEDILYVQEEPNNQEAECSLCGKTKDIVQMKGSGQYLCGNACDESDEEEEEEEEEEGKRKCETCAIHINTDDIIELSIEVNGHNLKLCLCENCFQDKADTLRKEGWNVDDFFEEEEADASEAEPSGEEEEEPSGEEEDSDSGESSYDDTQIRMAVLKSKKLDKDCLLGRLLGKSDMSDDKEEEEEEKEKEKEEEEPSGEEASEAEEDDEEVEEIMINKKMYYTTDIEHGSIYEDDDGDVGSKVGRFNNGNAEFY